MVLLEARRGRQKANAEINMRKFNYVLIGIVVVSFFLANLHYIQHKIITKRQIAYLRQTEPYSKYSRDFQNETMREIAKNMKVQAEGGMPYCWCVCFEQKMTKYVDGKL